MRIGVCASIHNVEKVARAGFEYIECPITELTAMDEAEFGRAIAPLRDLAVKVEVCNIFFPGIRMTGPEADMRVIAEYVKKALDRVARTGAEMLVLGNGGLRTVPDGWPAANARKQLVDVLRLIGDGCGPYGMTLLLEPLNKTETNLVNSVAEGLQMVRELAHPRVKLLADFYHVRMESEDMTSIVSASEWIQHLHFANGVARRYPMSTTDDDYQPFLDACKAIGYTRRISLEARTEDFDTDAPTAMRVMRELFS